MLVNVKSFQDGLIWGGYKHYALSVRFFEYKFDPEPMIPIVIEHVRRLLDYRLEFLAFHRQLDEHASLHQLMYRVLSIETGA
jgi:hypothetical protein